MIPSNAIAARIYEELAPLAYADAEHDYVLLRFIEAWTQSMVEIDDLVRDSEAGPGWAAAMNVETAPDKFLAFIGQFVGVRFHGSETPQQKRDLITALVNLRRGSPSATRAWIDRNLTGQKYVILNERSSGSAYRYAVRVRKSEMPETDQPFTNYLKNPSAEVSTANWVTVNGTLARSTAQKKYGTASFALTSNIPAGADMYIGIGSLDQAMPVVPGKRYSVAADFMPASTARTVLMYVQFYTAAGVFVSNGLGPVIPEVPGQWVRAVINNFDPPPTSAYAFPLAYVMSAANGETHYIDGLIAVEGDHPPPYFDGSLGGVWTGTAHNSISTRETTEILLTGLKEQKPAGLILDFGILEDITYDTIAAAYDSYTESYVGRATYLEWATELPGS